MRPSSSLNGKQNVVSFGYSEETNEQTLQEYVDLIEERKAEASINTTFRKQQMANYYNKKVKPKGFKVRESVLRSTVVSMPPSKLKKLSPLWEGPYVITEVSVKELHIGST